MTNSTTETLQIAISSGTTAAQTFKKKLRTEYKKCVGVVGYIVKQDAADKVRISLQDSNGKTIFESVHQDEVIGSTNVPSEFRYKSVSFESAGLEFKVVVSPIVELNSDFEMDFVFKVTNN